MPLKPRPGDSSPADRLAVRQQEALRRLRAFHDWTIAQRLKTADGSGLARALGYTPRRWPVLIRYTERAGRHPPISSPFSFAVRRPRLFPLRDW